MTSIIRFIVFWLLAVQVTIAAPMNPKTAPQPSALKTNPLNNVVQFDVAKANQTLEHLNLTLAVQNLNLTSLNHAIDSLNTLITQADQCIDETQKRLDNLDVLMRQAAGADAPKITGSETTGSDLIYLKNEQKKTASAQADCRLFSIRAKEAVETYKTGVAKLSQAATLARTEPIWIIAEKALKIASWSANISPDRIATPPLLSSPIPWMMLVVLSAGLTYVLLNRLQRSRLAHHHLLFRKNRVRHWLLLTFYGVITALWWYLLAYFQAEEEPNLWFNASQQLWIYSSGCLLLAVLFRIKRLRSLLQWHTLDVRFFQSMLLMLWSFYNAWIVMCQINQAFNLVLVVWQLLQSLWLLMLLITGVYFIHYCCKTHRTFHTIKHHHRFIERLGLFVCLLCAVLDIFGFHPLAWRLTSSGFMMLLILFVTISMIQGIHKSYIMLNQNAHTKAQIIKYFGYKPEQVFAEFLILKLTLQVVIIALGLYLVIRHLDFASYYLENTYTQLLYGIQLANTTVYPTRVVFGILVYCCLYLLFRSLSTSISRHQQFENEEETQVAIASIITYIGFTVALISALLVAGFDFTGLAIVAGALSVGIGLGLQSIVNNFVSGLILLIEKPIKPGDRINIDGIDGFVKKIRVRSTHLVTPNYEDIIVPNSDLITRRVTNYVYSNKQCAITCDITVPTDSHTEQVRAILLAAAHQHDEIIKTGRHKPYVLFRAIQEKTLAFQLCCLIKDVNKKLMVQSDLNFEIDQRLKTL